VLDKSHVSEIIAIGVARVEDTSGKLLAVPGNIVRMIVVDREEEYG